MSMQTSEGGNGADLVAAVGVSGDLQQVDGLHEAAVGDVDGRLALVLQVVAQRRQDVDHSVRQLHRIVGCLGCAPARMAANKSYDCLNK